MMQVEEDVERELSNEFMLQQLLTMAGVLDLSDEVGRSVLPSVLVFSDPPPYFQHQAKILNHLAASRPLFFYPHSVH